jgi:hypothetical protein
LEGITKVIDELGLIILSKEVEIELKEEQIEKLRKKIEMLEQYISVYDEFCNTKHALGE